MTPRREHMRSATEAPIFSKIEADRILRRAAEIDGADDSRHLTAKELRLIAREAGFGTDAVERALAEARAESEPSTRRSPVQKWGWVRVKMSTVREIPIEVTSEQLMTAVKLFQPYRDGPPHIKLEEREVTWRDRKGIQFAVVSTGGVTQIRVFLSKFLVRRGRWMGFVKAAADRLEVLINLVAEQGEAAAGELPPGRPYEEAGQERRS